MGELLYKDLTYKIRGAIFRVYNTLGFGHKEAVYQTALEIEFRRLGIGYRRECALDVLYEGERIGVYRPDFAIDGKILIELKAVSYMGQDAETQLLYYLKGTNYEVGLLVNFGSKELDIRRKVWTSYPRKSVINPR
jgi:GxxExxY protein